MAEEIQNQNQVSQEEHWAPFEGRGVYREGQADADFDDDSPIPDHILQREKDLQSAPPKEEVKKESQEEEKKGGGVLGPVFETEEGDDYFAEAKEVGPEEDGKEDKAIEEEAPAGRGRKPMTAEEREYDHVNKLFDIFEEDYGWQHIPQEQRPRTVREFTSFVQAVIAENSKPTYAHPELQALDEFVRRGGDLSTYFKTASEMNYDAMTLNTEYDQKRTVGEFLRLQGWAPEQIAKKVENYAKTGILEDEAKDALNSLRQYGQQVKQQQLAQYYQQQQQEAQVTQEFKKLMAETLTKTPDILGAQLTNKQRRELWDYMFAENKNGYTQFIIDYSSNPMSILSAAFLCKYGKDAVKAVEGSAQKRAIDTYRETIARQNVKSRGATRYAAASQGGKRKSFADVAKI